MRGRDPDEDHRPSTPLELFVDLTFVVAVAAAAMELHHGLSEAHVGHSIVSFVAVFFAIWWAWMGFTWFASAYDTDDVPYRLLVFVQMVGVLVLAAGVARAFQDDDFAVITVGYVIMRLSMVCQWLRAAKFDPVRRTTACRYALGIAIVQVGWIAGLALPDAVLAVSFGALVVAEITVPVWAESAGRTPWHSAHMAERYGLFAIIVIGESILAGTTGVQAALDGAARLGELRTVIVGGLLIVFSMWWIYFAMPSEDTAEHARRGHDERLTSTGGFGWGYGHLPLLASAAAVGAGLSVAIDHATDHSTIGAALSVTLPVAVFVVSVWAIHFPHLPRQPRTRYGAPVVALAIVAVSFGPAPILVAGMLMALLNATLAVDSSRAEHLPESLEAGGSS